MPVNRDIVVEIITMMIIILACIIGPIILINAQISYFFVVSGVIFTAYCKLLSEIIKRVSIVFFNTFKNRLNIVNDAAQAYKGIIPRQTVGVKNICL